MAVHEELGSGLLERVYQEPLVLELRDRGMAFGCEVEVNVHDKGRLPTCSYRADPICFPQDKPVLVELEACERLTHAHRARVIHTMKATRIQCALLMSFGGRNLQLNARGLGTRPCSWSSLYFAALRTVRFRAAATTVIGQAKSENPLYRHTRALTEGKTKPDLAKLTIARQIAAITLAVLEKEEEYDPEKLLKKTT